ncbi:MAG: DUF2325 domain-containing protein [Polyangiaceae bacterium]
MNDNASSRATGKEARAGRTVMVIGGNGGLSSRYREVVEKHGVELRHYEKRVPPSARRDAGKIALIVVMVGMVSHALREQAQHLAANDAEVVYLRTASISALRAAVDAHLG